MPARKRCPLCGSMDVLVERPSEYRYTHCGLSDVVLAGRGVQVVTCGHCSITSTRVEDEPQLLQVIGAALLMNPLGMRGEELRYLRTMFGMTQNEMARALGTDRRETIAEWERMDRIWTKPSLEIGPRALLLNMYFTNVVDSEQCVMSDGQKEALGAFQRDFVQHVNELLARKRASRVSITHRSRKNEWEVDRELALA